MNLQIDFKKSADLKQIEDLKKYLNKIKIAEISKIRVKKGKVKKGEMSGGKVLSTILLTIQGTISPFAKLAGSLVQYSISRKTDLVIKNSAGDEIALNSKLRTEDIMLLADKFLAAKKK